MKTKLLAALRDHLVIVGVLVSPGGAEDGWPMYVKKGRSTTGPPTSARPST